MSIPKRKLTRWQREYERNASVKFISGLPIVRGMEAGGYIFDMYVIADIRDGVVVEYQTIDKWRHMAYGPEMFFFAVSTQPPYNATVKDLCDEIAEYFATSKKFKLEWRVTE